MHDATLFLHVLTLTVCSNRAFARQRVRVRSRCKTVLDYSYRARQAADVFSVFVLASASLIFELAQDRFCFVGRKCSFWLMIIDHQRKYSLWNMCKSSFNNVCSNMPLTIMISPRFVWCEERHHTSARAWEPSWHMTKLMTWRIRRGDLANAHGTRCGRHFLTLSRIGWPETFPIVMYLFWHLTRNNLNIIE